MDERTQPGETNPRVRRNALVGCVGCAALLVAVVALAALLAGLAWRQLRGFVYEESLMDLHQRVLESEADDADRRAVLEAIEVLRDDRDAIRAGFLRWTSSLDRMERTVRDRDLTPSEADFLLRELERLSRRRSWRDRGDAGD